jgi:hypothetical protein
MRMTLLRHPVRWFYMSLVRWFFCWASSWEAGQHAWALFGETLVGSKPCKPGLLFPTYPCEIGQASFPQWPKRPQGKEARNVRGAHAVGSAALTIKLGCCTEPRYRLPGGSVVIRPGTGTGHLLPVRGPRSRVVY